VGPEAGLIAVKKRRNLLRLMEIEPQILGRPALSTSLYRLSSPGSLVNKVRNKEHGANAASRARGGRDDTSARLDLYSL
jgi:hypothetical protein